VSGGGDAKRQRGRRRGEAEVQREVRVRRWERPIKWRVGSGLPLDHEKGRPGRPIQVRGFASGFAGPFGL
jgi:hypothetical protein